MDTAGQKGTGKWTAINALDLGMPVTLIGEAVFARCLSAIKDERKRASKLLAAPTVPKDAIHDREQFVYDLEQALYASKIISYAQGFMLIREAARSYGWKLNNPAIALMWRGGCIIRSVFLAEITKAYRDDQIWKIYYSTSSSLLQLPRPNPVGEELLPLLLLTVFQLQLSLLR